MFLGAAWALAAKQGRCQDLRRSQHPGRLTVLQAKGTHVKIDFPNGRPASQRHQGRKLPSAGVSRVFDRKVAAKSKLKFSHLRRETCQAKRHPHSKFFLWVQGRGPGGVETLQWAELRAREGNQKKLRPGPTNQLKPKALVLVVRKVIAAVQGEVVEPRARPACANRPAWSPTCPSTNSPRNTSCW